MAKRILIYTNHYYPENFKINDVVQWLTDEKYIVRVITGNPNYPKGKLFKGYNKFGSVFVKENLKIVRLPLIPRGKGKKINLILNYLSYFVSAFFYTIFLILFKKKYELILVHHTSPFFIAVHPLFYKFFRRSKIFLWDLDLWPQSLNALNILLNKNILKLLEFIIKQVYRYYDNILISSKSFIKIVENRVERSKVIYFPNWADLTVEKSLKEKIKNNIFSKEKVNLLYAGNIGEAQDFNTLINACKKIDYDKIKFIILGDGRFKEEFIESVNINNLNKYFVFLKSVSNNEVFKYLNSADFLYLSLNDSELFKMTVPAKLQTYMAIGKPVIANINGEGANLIHDSKCGFVTDSGNSVGLIKIFDQILKLQKNEILKIGLNGKSFYQKNFKSELRKIELLKILI